ncbi:hypothetical protein ACOSQ3_000800 [Xanthoceras sorbifolium]
MDTYSWRIADHTRVLSCDGSSRPFVQLPFDIFGVMICFEAHLKKTVQIFWNSQSRQALQLYKIGRLRSRIQVKPDFDNESATTAPAPYNSYKALRLFISL